MISWLTRTQLAHLRFTRLLLALGLASQLGCVSPDLEQPADEPSTSARAPAELNPWKARGKLSVTVEGESHTARFEWQRHDLNRDTVIFSGPFAMNRQVMQREGASLIWLDGETTRAIQETSALAPPLRRLAMQNPEALGLWLLGHSNAATDWQLEVLAWQEVAPWMLPEQIRLVSEGVSVRIFVSAWELGAH